MYIILKYLGIIRVYMCNNDFLIIFMRPLKIFNPEKLSYLNMKLFKQNKQTKKKQVSWSADNKWR